jgi:predicted RNA binding protein YcfA (HicA-like mRNA interferase family)
MSKFDKLRGKILDGKSDANVNFDDLRNLLLSLGFVERVKGGHHSYRKVIILIEKKELPKNLVCSVTAIKQSLIKCGK